MTPARRKKIWWQKRILGVPLPRCAWIKIQGRPR